MGLAEAASSNAMSQPADINSVALRAQFLPGAGRAGSVNSVYETAETIHIVGSPQSLGLAQALWAHAIPIMRFSTSALLIPDRRERFGISRRGISRAYNLAK
jgi:hypothetical protein